MKSITMRFQTIFRAGVAVMAALVLSACSGGGGSGGGNTKTVAPPSTTTPTSFIYSGPAPNNVDVLRFQQAFYNNLVNHCSSCHTRGGAGKTAFVDRTDVNFAYSEALTVVNLSNPAASRIVDKVYSGGTGHNCWETSPAACRVQMISFIEAWANSDTTTSTSVKLARPVDRDPNGGAGGFRSFPTDAVDAGFVPGATPPSLYGLVLKYCSRCHSETSATKQQPYFASSDPLVAYEAIKSKIDLNDPSLAPNADPSLKAKSRLVVRLRDEFHNCWSSSCANDADTMQSAIRLLWQSITPTTLNQTAYRSQAQVLNDGVVGATGHRFDTYQIALWRFLEGEGDVISDTSGVSPAISLQLTGSELTGEYKWIGGGGIQFTGANAHGSPTLSKKLYDQIAAAGEYSIEAWAVPANVADAGKDIVTYGDGTSRNFMLGQTMTNYDFYNRSSATNVLGMVGSTRFSSDPNKKALQASLQHVVATYDPFNGRKIYVNGKLVSNAFPNDKGTLASDWDDAYSLILGKGWKGSLRLVAIHKRALSPAQIAQNTAVPPGEKRYVMFNVSKIANMPASCYDTATNTSYCYIYFEVSLYDNYAYLFNDPRFISFNSDITDLNTLVIKGIHIGINGKLSTVGQAYVNVDTAISTNPNSYMLGDEPGSGQLLMKVGTVMPKLTGPDVDLMYLEFDQIGTAANAYHPPEVGGPAFPSPYMLASVDPAIDLGWRTFDEINQSFAALTGVSVSDSTGFTADGTTPPSVGTVFSKLRSQLPAVEDFPAYGASHQTAVSQLAITYCSALMWNTNRRHAFFPANNDPANFRADWKTNFTDPLVTKFMSGGGLASAPSVSAISGELFDLIRSPQTASRNAGICAGTLCDSNDTRTLNAATAACAAGLANAALTLQ